MKRKKKRKYEEGGTAGGTMQVRTRLNTMPRVDQIEQPSSIFDMLGPLAGMALQHPLAPHNMMGGMMMKDGGDAKKTSEYMDALSGMDQDSIINPRHPRDTDVAMSRLEEMFPFLQYRNKDYSREQYQAAMQASRLYLNAPMIKEESKEKKIQLQQSLLLLKNNQR